MDDGVSSSFVTGVLSGRRWNGSCLLTSVQLTSETRADGAGRSSRDPQICLLMSDTIIPVLSESAVFPLLWPFLQLHQP